MKYKVIGISTLLFLFPLFTFASLGERPLALTTYSSSEVSTGGIQVGAGGSAHSQSGSAEVTVTNAFNANNNSGVVEVKVETETDGVVHKESIKKTTSQGEEVVQVFVATSSGSARAAAQVNFFGTGSTSTERASSSVFRLSNIFQWLPHMWFGAENKTLTTTTLATSSEAQTSAVEQPEPLVERLLERLLNVFWFF